jgi:hypothetical protein
MPLRAMVTANGTAKGLCHVDLCPHEQDAGNLAAARALRGDSALIF